MADFVRMKVSNREIVINRSRIDHMTIDPEPSSDRVGVKIAMGAERITFWCNNAQDASAFIDALLEHPRLEPIKD